MNTRNTDETAYLLRSENMKRRLLEAIERDGEGALSFEDVRARFKAKLFKTPGKKCG